MVSGTPDVLSRLLAANTPASRDDAWAAFVAAYTRLILHVARSLGGDHDAAMDRYSWVLEQLRRNDCHRLRAFAADGRSEFSTWLVVVAQRICLDHHRHRYGRGHVLMCAPGPADEQHAARRRLVDLIAADVEIDSLIDRSRVEPADAIAAADLNVVLNAALATLAPTDRLLIKLRFEDDLSMPEIARQLGFPTRFHAYRRLARVLAELRPALRRVGLRDAIA
jgi:RNA polymerase sigma factor (sigma-70 family)